jgi:hypothetical protein
MEAYSMICTGRVSLNTVIPRLKPSNLIVAGTAQQIAMGPFVSLRVTEG